MPSQLPDKFQPPPILPRVVQNSSPRKKAELLHERVAWFLTQKGIAFYGGTAPIFSSTWFEAMMNREAVKWGGSMV